MPGLVAPTQDTIDSWRLAEHGVKDGSSPRVTFDRTGSIATRQIECLWEHRYAVARWFVGQVDHWDNSGVDTLTRLLPQKLPKPAGEPLWVPDFYATKIAEITGLTWDGNEPDDWHRMERDGDDNVGSINPNPMPVFQFTEETLNRFTHALLTVQYERLPYVLENDEGTETEDARFVQLVPKPSAPEYLTVPSSTQVFIAESGVGFDNPAGHLIPVPYPVGLTESGYRFILRWHRLPYDVWGPGTALWARVFGDGTTSPTGLPYLNAVNKTQFYGTFSPGTVMLEEVTDEIVPVLFDEYIAVWTIDFHFWVKPGGHNKQWHFPNTNGFAGAGNAAKRLLVGRGNTYYAPGSVPDLYANYIERDLYQLFNIDGP